MLLFTCAEANKIHVKQDKGAHCILFRDYMEGLSKSAEAVHSPLIIGVDKLSAATTGETATSEHYDNERLQNLHAGSKGIYILL